MTPLENLYQHAGRAMHKAQIVEFNLVTLLVLLEKIDPSATKPTKDKIWSKKTLGQLLHPVIKSGVISIDAKLFFETLMSARNHLAHSIFMSDASLCNDGGVCKLIREVCAIIDVFDIALVLLDKVIQLFSSEVGIDYQEIKKKSRDLVLSQVD